MRPRFKNAQCVPQATNRAIVPSSCASGFPGPHSPLPGLESRIPNPESRLKGFSLIELLVAMAVFAIMAALAYGGLNSIARTRTELGAKEDAFRDLMRVVGSLDGDLRETVARPVRGNAGQIVPAFIGTSDHVEFTRLGFANPQAEPRSNLQRVFYELDAGRLKRGRYAVLDRAPDSAPQIVDSHVKADELRLRYLDPVTNRWLDAWPAPLATDATALPRAVQWQLRTRDYGEITQTVELVSAWPNGAAGMQQ
ncbi:MAG TPA: type II secretion system minor pseudopilin GspJ [Rudaea sp.]|nr:type II secretion system minor pseudopilin GspJ [Rudaea sp.]